MVRNSSKWNYSSEKANKVIHDNLIAILKGSEMIEVNELISSLNKRAKKSNFKRYGRKKDIISYIIEYYEDIVSFAHSFIIYNVIFKDKKVYLSLNDIEHYDTNNMIKKDTEFYLEWEFIDVPEFYNFF
jgi:hypothetical protein